jgi:hypothetical protein
MLVVGQVFAQGPVIFGDGAVEEQRRTCASRSPHIPARHLPLPHPPRREHAVPPALPDDRLSPRLPQALPTVVPLLFRLQPAEHWGFYVANVRSAAQ